MRVIAGTLGGRMFDSPRGRRTHPMSDKIRGALFNALGDLDGLTVLDAFAGSGACAFEAVSRGAAGALAIDIDPAAVRTIAGNVRALGVSGAVTVRQANAGSWSRANPDARFDVVLADPPYDDVRPELLERLSTHVRPEGLLVLSYPGGQEAPLPAGFTVVSGRQYGDAQLVFCRKAG